MTPNHYQIYDLSWDGRGVARDPDGRVVMISGALPGDTVTATLAPASSRGPLSGRLKEIITPSPDRIPHPCTYHHSFCLTTPLGSWRYECALNWKRKHLLETLKRIGGIENPSVAEAVPSPQKWEYRDRLELHLYSDKGRWSLGYCSAEGYFAVRDCLLGSKSLRQGLTSLVTALDSVSVYPKALPTESDRCFNPNAVRVLVRDNGQDETVAVLFVQEPGNIDLIVLAQALADSNLLGWQIRHAPHSRSRFFQSQIIEKRGATQVFHQINGAALLTADPTVFSQVNRQAGELLVQRALEALPPSGRLLDLYGGYGAFGLAYALLKGGRATIVESSVLAANAGAVYAREHNLPVEFVNANLSKTGWPDLDLNKFDAAILDPPRAGAAPQVLQMLDDGGPRQVLYLSCHPATLARDIKRLKAYRPVSFVPVDLFPQTPDLETIAFLVRD